ncbi:Uncharacterised protein [Bordetella pertussis]|nr:Uncharacterised protein [Bordetella pertussis]
MVSRASATSPANSGACVRMDSRYRRSRLGSFSRAARRARNMAVRTSDALAGALPRSTMPAAWSAASSAAWAASKSTGLAVSAACACSQ